LWYVYFLARQSSIVLTNKRSFLLGAISVGLVIFSRHLLTLPVAAIIAFIFITSLWKHKNLFGRFVLGAVASLVILAIVYWLGSGELSLFGRGGTMGSYAFVLRQIPIARPFSRNVQISNLLERYNLFASDAPGVLLIIFSCVVLIVLYKIWQRRMTQSGKH
jgi:hypothetical protein